MVSERFAHATRVRFSVLPHFRLIAGIVVPGGVEILDFNLRMELRESRMPVVVGWDVIDEIELEVKYGDEKK